MLLQQTSFENIVAKGKLLMMSTFPFCHNVFSTFQKSKDDQYICINVFKVVYCRNVICGKVSSYNYYISVTVVIVVFDLSDESSMASISRWMTDATASTTDPIKFVVGTKKDIVVRIDTIFTFILQTFDC